MNEPRAIRKLKRGDISGLEWLVRAYQTKALRTAFLIVHDTSLAEDIVQSAFVKVFERIHLFDSNRPFLPWFLKIIANDALKSLTHHREVSIEDADPNSLSHLEILPSNIMIPDAKLEAVETAEELKRFLRS